MRAALHEHRAEALAQRVKANRRMVIETVDRFATATRRSQTSRSRAGTLRFEVRAGLDQFIESVAAAAAVIERPVPSKRYAVSRIVRFRPTAPPDPVDAARRETHEFYAATRDPEARALLLESYDGFARSLAAKFRHRESMDDLVQVARIGLLHAIDRFDPELGRPFPLFARITITGELKRHLRDRTWGMRVPRSLQEDYLEVMRAVDELTAERSDSPSMEAVAERCGMSVDRVLEAMELRVSQRALSIDAPATIGSDEPVLDLGQEDAGFGHLENRDLIAHLLARLPERDRRIIELRFMEDKTQSEIAAEIGVSQMCVSRVLARTLGRLRLWARAATN
jgi:RNA polymerase sigma-B factor